MATSSHRSTLENAAGMRAVALYYQHSPEIASLLAIRPRLASGPPTSQANWPTTCERTDASRSKPATAPPRSCTRFYCSPRRVCVETSSRPFAKTPGHCCRLSPNERATKLKRSTSCGASARGRACGEVRGH